VLVLIVFKVYYYFFVDMEETVGSLIDFNDEPGLPLPVQTALTTPRNCSEPRLLTLDCTGFSQHTGTSSADSARFVNGLVTPQKMWSGATSGHRTENNANFTSQKAHCSAPQTSADQPRIPVISPSPLVGLNVLFPAFPVFNGDKDVNWWLTQFEEMATDCSINEKARLLLLKLGEKVQDCIDVLPLHLRHDYNAIVAKLRDHYAAQDNDRVWYAALMNRKKESHESISEYMRDIQRLVSKLNVHMSHREQYYTCNAFLNGLPPSMLLRLGPMQGKTANELLQSALYYEEIERKISKTQYDHDRLSPPRRVFRVEAEQNNQR